MQKKLKSLIGMAFVLLTTTANSAEGFRLDLLPKLKINPAISKDYTSVLGKNYLDFINIYNFNDYNSKITANEFVSASGGYDSDGNPLEPNSNGFQMVTRKPTLDTYYYYIDLFYERFNLARTGYEKMKITSFLADVKPSCMDIVLKMGLPVTWNNETNCYASENGGYSQYIGKAGILYPVKPQGSNGFYQKSEKLYLEITSRKELDSKKTRYVVKVKSLTGYAQVGNTVAETQNSTKYPISNTKFNGKSYTVDSEAYMSLRCGNVDLGTLSLKHESNLYTTYQRIKTECKNATISFGANRPLTYESGKILFGFDAI